MRTEKEMYDMLLNIAQEDERIKAVYMNGSRTNKNVPSNFHITIHIPNQELSTPLSFNIKQIDSKSTLYFRKLLKRKVGS